MRKHVKPALPLAVILDPARGRRLPPQGGPVTWSHYWEALLARGDIEVSDIEVTDAAPAPADAEPKLGA